MSSSAIGFITVTYGPTGPTGNIGNRGPTGPDGATSGSIGLRGSYAPHIENVTFYSAGATVIMSDGTEYSAIGAFGGATSTDYSKVQTVDYLNPLTDVTTYSFISSGEGTSSFVMRGISGSGSLVVTEDSQAIYIDSIYTPLSGLVDSASLTNNTLIYLKEKNQISSTTIGVTSGAFYTGALNFEQNASTPKFSKLLPRAKVKYVQPNYKTEAPAPVVLNVNDAGVFYVRTPNGISAFSGNFNNSEIVSFTIITESDDLWNFPANVYFETGENYLTCGKSILNLTSFDQGNSWYATVAARGIDGTTFNCELRSIVGSCCYSGITGTTCRDFVTRNECDAIAGTFHPLQSCVETCGSTFGVCCSNGKCIENSNYAECTAFGGKFLFGVNCDSLNASVDPAAPNSTRLCFDRCKEPVACCKDGVCLGDDYTKIECEQIIGGVAFPGRQCEEIDCCIQNVKVGACCYLGTCSQETLIRCNEIRGVFLGEGVACGEVNCGCFPDAGAELGSCCECITNQNGQPLFTCSITTLSDCQNPETWVYNPNYVSDSVCLGPEFVRCTDLAAQYNCVEQQGKCCFCDPDADLAVSCTFTTRANCFALSGRNDTFTPGETCATPCDPCKIPCTDCQTQTPGVKCRCLPTPNGGIINCEDVPDISDPNAGCDEPGVTCVGSTTCLQNPCQNVLQDCYESNCLVPPVSESVECPGTSDISTGSTCTDCFATGIPEGSGQINYTRTHRSRGVAGEPDGFPKIFEDSIFSSYNVESNTPNCSIVQGNNASRKPVIGYNVKDYYIPIKDKYKCSNGTDLQFCIEIEMQEENTDLTESVRAYVLRTWYPKYFSTNMAAYQGLTLSDNVPINFIDPNTKGEEYSVWGSLGKLTLANTQEPQNIDKYEYYYNLGSFITENGYNYINIQNSPQNLGDESSINLNTVRLIEELNCPLYGLNPRGRYLNHESGLINPDAPIPTGNARPQIAFRNSAGFVYAEGISYNNPFYYQSTNIGGRFGSDLSSLSSDVTNIDGINFQWYNNESAYSRSGYVSKARQQANVSGISITNDKVKYTRTYGYTDFGYCEICETLLTNPTVFYPQYDDTDTNNILSIGYYPLNATLNRFGNVFINRRLYVETFNGNDPAAETLIPYGFSNPGHPLTIDYEANIELRQTQFPTPSERDVFSYDVANPYNNTADGENVKRAPIYKTRHSSIICDTGTMDVFGNYIPDYNLENQQTGQAPKVFAKKRKVYGAINNPWYANGAGGQTPDPAETVISKTATGIKLCIKLKNYRDYILTDDQIPPAFLDTYDALMDEKQARNKRVLNYKNSLRIVVFSNPYNSFSDQLRFGDVGNNPYSTLSTACGQYTGRVYYSPENANLNKNIIKYGCTNTSCSCESNENSEGTCNSCNINELDKQTNGYGAANLENLVCAIIGGPDTNFSTSCLNCLSTITSQYGIGGTGRSIGSILTCTCAPSDGINCAESSGTNGISSLFNCRNCDHTSPCSCKTSTLNYAFNLEGGQVTCPPAQECTFCGDCSSAPPGAITPPFGCLLIRECGKCPAGCNLMTLFNEITSGGALIAATAFIKSFFNEYGYIENQDYWIVDTSDVYPMVVWKLLPSVETINGIPTEKYNFPYISPPEYMAASVGGKITSYYRNTICGPNGTSTDPITIQNCGLNVPINGGIICTNFCELAGEACTNKINTLSLPLTPETTTLINNLIAHSNDSDSDGLYEPEENILNIIAAPCPSGQNLTQASAYKKIYVSEDQFICVNMDCSSIDCSQFEDCPS
jgi:hypothetical protein